MIIKKIHMDQFGKFQDYSLELGPNFNLIYGNNEEGKSTIMAFIQMMFYGYSGRSRDLTKHLRNKYRPWNGGDMKGHIIFEAKEAEYRLERSFGQSNSTDEVGLWNETTGQQIRLTSKNDVGLEFFGFGEEAFARSVFIGQGGTNIQGTSKSDEITHRLSNLITSGSEEVSYQDVARELDDAMSLLVSKNRKKGLLVKKEQELALLEEMRQIALQDEADKLSLQEELTTMENQKQEAIEQKQAVRAKIQSYELLKRKEVITKTLERLEDFDQLENRLLTQSRRLQGEKIRVDESYLNKAKSFMQELTDLNLREKQLTQEIQQLKLKNAELEKNRPFQVHPENFAKTRQNIDQLMRAESKVKDFEAEIDDLERFLEESEKVRALQESWEDAVFIEKEALEALKKLREQSQETQITLKTEVGLEAAARNQHIEMQVSLKSLAVEIQDKERQLETERSELERKLSELNSDSNQSRHDLGSENTSGKSQGIIYGIGALILGLAALILGSTINSLYYIGLFGALFLIYLAFKTTRSKAEVPGEIGRHSRAEFAQILEQEASQSIQRKAEDLAEKKLELQTLQKQASEIETSFSNAQTRLKQIQAKLEQEQELENQAKLDQLRAFERTQALKQSLDQKQAELAKTSVQGTRFDLVEKKVALSEYKAEIADLNRQIESSLQKTGAKDLNGFTDLYYDGLAYGGKLESVDKKITELELDQTNCQAKQEDKRKEALAHMSLYQPVTSLAGLDLLVANLERDLDELNRLTIQTESIYAQRQELEANYSKEQLLAELKVLEETSQESNQLISENLEATSVAQWNDEVARLSQTISVLDRSVAAKAAQAKEKYRHKPNVSQIDEQMEELHREISQYRQEYEALKLSQEVLAESFAEMQRSFGPLLNESTAKILSRLTHGKYRQVRVNRDFDIAVEDRKHNSLREWGYLSGGTVDQAYLSLRLAIADLINPNQEPLPLFLDDVFTQYDDNRARQGLEFLLEHTQERAEPIQAVFFTCHNRLLEWTDDIPGCQIYKLL